MNCLETRDDSIEIVERHGVVKMLRLVLAYALYRGSVRLDRTAQRLIVDLRPSEPVLAEAPERPDVEAEAEPEEAPWFRALQQGHKQGGSARDLPHHGGAEWATDEQGPFAGTGEEAQHQRPVLRVPAPVAMPAPQKPVSQTPVFQTPLPWFRALQEAHFQEAHSRKAHRESTTDDGTAVSAPPLQIEKTGPFESGPGEREGGIEGEEAALERAAESAYREPSDLPVWRNDRDDASLRQPGDAMQETVQQKASSGRDGLRGRQVTHVERDEVASTPSSAGAAGQTTARGNASWWPVPEHLVAEPAAARRFGTGESRPADTPEQIADGDAERSRCPRKVRPSTKPEGPDIAEGEYTSEQWPGPLRPAQQPASGPAAVPDWPRPTPWEQSASHPANYGASAVAERDGFGAVKSSPVHESLPGAEPRENGDLHVSEGWPELPEAPVYLHAGRELERFQRAQRRSDEQRGIF